jgi:uncharacterized Zn-finger protein
MRVFVASIFGCQAVLIQSGFHQHPRLFVGFGANGFLGCPLEQRVQLIVRQEFTFHHK